jgi:hypothetical protein
MGLLQHPVRQQFLNLEPFRRQAWVLEPAADDDLIRAESEVTRMARVLAPNGLNPKAHSTD